MNKLLILTCCTKFVGRQWNYNEIKITAIFGCLDTVKVRNNVIFKHKLVSEVKSQN